MVARTALWVTVVYVLAAVVWVALSDELLRRLTSDPDLLARLQTLKGWAFVAVTGVVLYVVLRRRGRTLDRSVAEVAARERLLEAIRRAAPVGIVVLGRDGELVSWNPGAERLLERTDAEIGRPLPWVDGDGNRPPDWMVRARRGEPVTDAEARLRRRDGGWVLVLVSAGPLKDPADQMLGVVAVLTDVTRRRELEARLRRAHQLEALEQVAGGVAHEFRNVLTVLSTVAEGMRARIPTDDPELRADLEELLRGAERGRAVSRRLLAFGRPEQLDLRPLDLRHATSEAAGVLRRLLPPRIEVSVEAPSGAVTARGDANALIYVFTNLATNARDAMPDGGRLRMVVRVEPDGSGPASAVIEVSDTGHGMDPATLERALDPFFTTRPDGVGTGLGLSVVQGLVAGMGGAVELESEEGRGTTVRLRFPLVSDEPASAAAGPWPGVIRGGSETILVVEDEAAIRRSARRALERLGYSVLVAEDGVEALALLCANPDIALVISDSMMPRLGGVELYERLREEGMRVPFLLASGSVPPEAGDGGLLRHDLPFLPKPWTLNELTRKVRELLDAT